MFVLKTTGFYGMANCPFLKFNFDSSYISLINNINSLRGKISKCRHFILHYQKPPIIDIDADAIT